MVGCFSVLESLSTNDSSVLSSVTFLGRPAHAEASQQVAQPGGGLGPSLQGTVFVYSFNTFLFTFNYFFSRFYYCHLEFSC